MAILGAVLLVLSVVLFFVQQGANNKLRNMQIQTAKAGDLQQIAQGVATEIGAGAWQEYNELKGTVFCNQPLKSELTRTPCVYYAMEVIREYEEPYTERDEKGNERTEIRRGSETIAQNSQAVPFILEDETGRIVIDPAGADLDGVQVLNDFRSERGGTLKLGSFSLALPNFSGPRRTLGYRFTETVIPVGRAVYVLGQVRDQGGKLVVEKPTEKDRSFIISLKSEEELQSASQSTARWTFYGAIASAVLGLGLVVFGLVAG